MALEVVTKIKRWAWYSLVLFTFMSLMFGANMMLWEAMTGHELDLDLEQGVLGDFIQNYLRRQI